MAPTTFILSGVLMLPLVLSATTTTKSLPSNVQTLWGLCGGLCAVPTPFTRTICEEGATCVIENEYYWQCLPATPTAPSTFSTATSPVTTTATTTTTTTTSRYPPLTTTQISTTPAPVSKTTTPSATKTVVQTKYGQCGGAGWTGPTVCQTGSTCATANAYFAQCL
ncbi:hypothetical protein H072_2260 [Dactylellina haptotyla CBS 200.50]|uniref:CBM1 domain-containing protein n=1 Tax=Dactylellina haptotyla (strain CBS 200.50) TaxID=1284197 RepID=S8C7M7_DACHA|nr:hypothetical protein H072_2260 [Dactylellina haptotyla CBS 200.50]